MFISSQIYNGKALKMWIIAFCLPAPASCLVLLVACFLPPTSCLLPLNSCLVPHASYLLVLFPCSDNRDCSGKEECGGNPQPWEHQGDPGIKDYPEGQLPFGEGEVAEGAGQSAFLIPPWWDPVQNPLCQVQCHQARDTNGTYNKRNSAIIWHNAQTKCNAQCVTIESFLGTNLANRKNHN